VLLLPPSLACLFQVAPGATGKAHEAADSQGHPQAALVGGAVEGAQGAQHVAAFAGDGAAGGELGCS
jgi:hypothetical protein